MTIKEARAEVDRAWRASYSPERNRAALEALNDQPIEYRVSHLIARLFFRGIYFPQMTKRAWMKLVVDNRRVIYPLVKEAFVRWRAARRNKSDVAVLDRAS
jgi:hypothetical protein